MSSSADQNVSTPTLNATMIMNEHAAFCIEIGIYEEAITSLATALEIMKEEPSEIIPTAATAETNSCGCADCTLDGCIRFSRNYSKLTPKQRSKLRCCHQQSHQRDATQPQDSSFAEWPSIITASGSVYSHPIRAPRTSILEGHAMDRNLVQMILTFNLALALHLQSMLCPQKDHDEYCCAFNIDDASGLYKEVFRLQLDRHQDGSPGSACLKMILANNLGVAMYQGSKKESDLRETVLREAAVWP